MIYFKSKLLCVMIGLSSSVFGVSHSLDHKIDPYLIALLEDILSPEEKLAINGTSQLLPSKPSTEQASVTNRTSVLGDCLERPMSIKPLSNKKNLCDLCYKLFSCRSKVLRHRVVHTGEKAFSCKRCSRSFSQKSTLKSHSIRHVMKYIDTHTIPTAKFFNDFQLTELIEKAQECLWKKHMEKTKKELENYLVSA